MEQIVELTKENLGENQIELGEVLADAGYSSGGEALKYCFFIEEKIIKKPSLFVRRLKNNK